VGFSCEISLPKLLYRSGGNDLGATKEISLTKLLCTYKGTKLDCYEWIRGHALEDG
jgi:hypothetical protein